MLFKYNKKLFKLKSRIISLIYTRTYLKDSISIRDLLEIVLLFILRSFF